MHRRQFLQTAAAAVAAHALPAVSFARANADPPIRITKASLEPMPGRIIQTTGYNGTVPGPMLRLKEGVPVTIDLVNDTAAPEFVHFHGLATSVVVDGSEEEHSPVLMPGANRRITFTP